MEKRFFDMRKESLLALAGIVWLIAGFNVARLGVLSYQASKSIYWYHYASSIVIFILFGTMFYRMVKKHEKRIGNYQEEYKPFWYFFDTKSYLIMAFMMTGGILLRSSHLLKDEFIAYFYTGLGIALGFAGVLFLYLYLKKR